MTKKTEMQPIFIFSLPRSGSTLLQRIIASNEDVSTASEPWVLLPFLYGLKKEGVYAEYSHFIVHHALQDMCKVMPNGKEDYLAAIRTAMLYIYKSISTTKSKFFLDKTPRYALVAEEIINTFPDGKVIFLWRNPLAVIASIVDTFNSGKWKIFHSKVDLFDGMDNLIKAYEKNRTQVLSIKYEDLVTDPITTLQRIEDYLGLTYDKSQIDSFAEVQLSGTMGDPTGVEKYNIISTQSLDGWKETITNPWRKYWCRRYLLWIGKERLSLIGYELDMLCSELEGIPNRWGGLVPDLLYSLYGFFYCTFEFKILMDKLRKISKRKLVKKHD